MKSHWFYCHSETQSLGEAYYITTMGLGNHPLIRNYYRTMAEAVHAAKCYLESNEYDYSGFTYGDPEYGKAVDLVAKEYENATNSIS